MLLTKGGIEMKKFLKSKLLKMFLVVAVCFVTVGVSAESVASSLTMTHYTISKKPMSFPTTFRVKKTSSGKYAYCAYYAKHPPVKSIKYKKGSLVDDDGLNYIMKESFNAKSDSSFFVYQTAMWVYMVKRGIMPGAYSDITVFQSTLNSSSSSTAKKIKSLVNTALSNSSKIDNSKPTISVNTNGVKFTLSQDGQTYISSAVLVESSTGKFNVSLTSAPTGTGYSIDGKNLYFKIPKSSITALNTSISFKVSNSKDVYEAYYYTPSDSSYQKMVVPYKNTLTASSDGSLSLHESTSIEILKTDANGLALKGAELQVLNSKGVVVDSWTSDGQKHKVSGLTEGSYVVKETKAPTGYKLSSTQIKFSVDASGKVKNSNGIEISFIAFKNEKMSVTVSKQDIANSTELPGATLVIKNSDGKEVVKWTSSTKPYVIKGLAVGTYTLTETIAPDGYTKSSETITFKIGEDGKVYNQDGKTIDKVIMYNQKSSTPGGVSISKQDATTGKELPGATLVVKDYDGKVIDTWVSTDKPHLIENLTAGIYTLTETIAPNGYILSTETVTFTVKDDGSVTKVVMYNSPNSKDLPSGNGGEEVPVESTGSYKTITSTVVGTLITFVGGIVLFKSSKKKEN